MQALLITGWAHHPQSLEPLAEALRSALDCDVRSPNDFLGKENCSNPTLSTPAIVIGWSLGGLIALESVAQRRFNAIALVLISSTARFVTAPDYTCGTPSSELRAMKIGLQRNPADTLRRFHRQVCAPRVPLPEPTVAFVAQGLADGIGTLIKGLEYLAQTDLRPWISSLDVPILLLHGDADAVIPWTASEYIAQHHLKAQLSLFRDVGHNLPLAFPSDVARRILNFLKYAVT